MTKSNIVVVCDHINEAGVEILRSSKDIDLRIAYDEPKEKLGSFVHDASLVITRSSTPITQEFLDLAPNLRFVIRAGVGVDNVNIDECSKRGIVVMNIPTANTIAAVELTMTHILASLRSFVGAHNELKNDRKWKRENWYGKELLDKKLGIIGFGNIGSRVGVRAKSFDARVIAYDPYINESQITSLGITCAKSLDEILSCDIITIHTPKNQETIGMIGEEEIAKMKDGVILINVARGGLYNEDAILNALRSGKISFFGVDVFTKEPACDNPLLDMPNIHVTPHIGANTYESQIKIATQAANNAIDVIRGISYPNALNMPFKESEIPERIIAYFELTQRLAFLASKLTRGAAQKLSIHVEGEVQAYTDSIKAYAIVGALRHSIDENVNYVNASFIAEQRGLSVDVSQSKHISAYKNKISVRTSSANDFFNVAGTIFGENDFRLVSVNDFMVDVYARGRFIFFTNSDVPGVIGEVGTLLGKRNINIADFRLSRNSESQALAIILVDEEITQDTLDELKKLKSALDVRYAQI